MNELQSIRKELGYTQEETCKILKKSRRSLQFYENEESKLSNKQEEVYEELVKELSDILERDYSGRNQTVHGKRERFVYYRNTNWSRENA